MAAPLDKLAVVAWQHRFCAFMCAIYVLCIGMGAFMLMMSYVAANEEGSVGELLIPGLAAMIFGVGLSLAYGVAPFLRPAPWVWTYHLVLIAVGLTSVCCLPICIPLLIGWIRSDTKAYFGRV